MNVFSFLVFWFFVCFFVCVFDFWFLFVFIFAFVFVFDPPCLGIRVLSLRSEFKSTEARSLCKRTEQAEDKREENEAG